MFTAVAVAHLVDAGEVGLHNFIGRYVQSVMVEAGLVTVGQSLTHSSGLGNYPTPTVSPPPESAHGRRLSFLIASDKPSAKSGTRVEYPNAGFVLLGLLIERASGES